MSLALTEGCNSTTGLSGERADGPVSLPSQDMDYATLKKIIVEAGLLDKAPF